MGITENEERRINAMEDAIKHLREAMRDLDDVDPRDWAKTLEQITRPVGSDFIANLIKALAVTSDAIEPACLCRTPGDGLCPRHDGTPEEHAAGLVELKAWMATVGRGAK